MFFEKEDKRAVNKIAIYAEAYDNNDNIEISVNVFDNNILINENNDWTKYFEISNTSIKAQMNQSYIYADVSQLNKYYFITVQTKTNTKLNVYLTGNSINQESAIYTDDYAII